MTAQIHKFIDLEPQTADFRTAVQAGLATTPKWTPAKFFYDESGAALFEQICELPEYYPTRTECGILRDHADELRSLLPAGATVVEFGSGSADKIRLLLAGLNDPATYVPIDISREHLLHNAESFAADNPEISVVPVCADFTTAIDLDGIDTGGPRVGFFPGSTIGNLTPDEAADFLRDAARTLGSAAHMVIGVDLVKDGALLEAAYDDAAGVTAAFNLNLLHRINRELDGTFRVDAFAHRAVWNAAQSRVEMHLVSKEDQMVTVAGESFAFSAGEALHTESSYKYTVDSFRGLAARGGFRVLQTLVDPNDLFSVHVLQAGVAS
ncbi:L-histidine N(alpha)-methyltransferase [Minwuia sp.]|uniref:L-histidine N(alpha)-methyltransferase n=1 Tax=Minwuia sp. TaxID=2493630 RepID=UPI003A933F03